MTEPTASPDVTELLPCPFCGCSDIVASNVGEDEDNWFVGCMESGCGVNPGVFCPDSEAEAIAAWNRRVPDLALRQEVERLREVLATAEAVMSIVEPRSDKAQYVATIEKMRLALQPKEN